MIKVENVTKTYGTGQTEVSALRGISLTINAGEFVSIAGPSGSGKTTLLNLIGCLDTSTSGEIFIEDIPVSKKTPRELALFRRHKLGFVFQSFNLIPVLKAHENVSFALSLLKVSGDELMDRTMSLLDEVGLKGMEHRYPRELSGGQQQRVAIARALEALNESHGTTFIFSTHDKMVMDHAKRLVMLHDGTITDDERRS